MEVLAKQGKKCITVPRRTKSITKSIRNLVLLFGMGMTLAAPLKADDLYGSRNSKIIRRLPVISCETIMKKQNTEKINISEAGVSIKFEFGRKYFLDQSKKYYDFLHIKDIHCSNITKEMIANLSTDVDMSKTTTEQDIDKIMLIEESANIAGYEFRVHSINCDDKIVTFRVFDGQGNELDPIDVSNSMSFRYANYEITISVSDFVKGIIPQNTSVRVKMSAVKNESDSERRNAIPSLDETSSKLGATIEFKRREVRGEIGINGIYTSRTEKYNEAFTLGRIVNQLPKFWMFEVDIALNMPKFDCRFVLNQEHISAFGIIDSNIWKIILKYDISVILASHINWRRDNLSMELLSKRKFNIIKRVYLKNLKVFIESDNHSIAFENGIYTYITETMNPSGSNTVTVMECEQEKIIDENVLGGIAGEIALLTKKRNNEILLSFVVDNKSMLRNIGIRYSHSFK